MASATAEQTPAPNNTGAPSAGRGGGGRNRRGGASGGGGGDGGREERRPNRGRGRGGRGGGDEPAGTGGRGGPRKPRGIGRGGDINANARKPGDSNGPAQTLLRVAPGVPPAVQDSDDAASEGTESEVCFICADPVRYIAVPPCNHPTCHICSLRMRALYKSKTCAHCRVESEYVIFTKEHEKLFEDFKDSETIAENAALGIKYDDQAICDDATLLLRYNCPEETCDRACLGWPDLHGHVKREHSRVMCDLCTRHKKVFTHEHELFTAAELRRHERHGDDQPGSESQSGFKGHPECQFCNQRFYSVDELFVHCRDKHERCHICERSRPADQQPQYYFNYDTLELHFKKAHYVCPESECLEKKFVVFEHEIDLKAHQLEKHPNGLSKTAMRDARRIDMSNFQDARSVQPQNDGRRRGRGGRGGDSGGGRGRHELEDPPIRTVQHMSRAEIAFHRTQQLAIQSAQSTTPRTFGGQLSEPAFAARPAPQPARPPQTQSVEVPQSQSQQPRHVPGSTPAPPRTITPPTSNAAFPPLAAARPANPTRSAQPAQPTQNPAETRALRHASVIDRASNMLRNDATKMQLFRNDISKFRTGAISGENLVDMLWSLFDGSAKELNTLINEVAELYEDESKRREFLKAWNNWKAINQDYPPIAGASSQSASTSTNANRVLKLKSSTARSGRSAAASAWGTAAVAPTQSASSASSALPKPIVNPNRVGKGAVSATPWVTKPAAPPPPTTTTYASSSSSSSAAATRRPVGRDEFPSLPPKKQPAGWTPIPSRNRWDAPAATGNAWVPGSAEAAAQDEADNLGENGGGKKKKGKQKQLLFHVGL